MAGSSMNDIERVYKQLVKASKVRWKELASKDEQIKFLKKLSNNKKNSLSKNNQMKIFFMEIFFSYVGMENVSSII